MCLQSSNIDHEDSTASVWTHRSTQKMKSLWSSIILVMILNLEAFSFQSTPNIFYSRFSPPTCFLSMVADAEESRTRSGGRVNTNVRNLMSVIKKRFNTQVPEQSWTKTRNYLYSAADKLTESQVNQVLSFLENTFVDQDLCAFIVQNSPRILRRNVKTHLQPTSTFLQQLYGPDLFQQAVRRNPDLLLTRGMGYKADELELVELFLREELQLKQASINKLKKTAPVVFQLPMYKILSMVHYLADILEAGGDSKEKSNAAVGKLIVKHPHLLQLSVEKNLKPRMDFLREECQLNEDDLGTLIQSSSGGILGLSIEENLKPTIDFLKSILPKEYLPKSVLAHPQLLGLSLTNLRAKVNYFDAIDQGSSKVQSPSLTSRILMRAPAVFSLSLDNNIIPTVEFLAKVWGATPPNVTWIDDEQVILDDKIDRDSTLASLLSEYPTIMTLSLEGNIQPTVNFFNRTGYVSLDDNWQLRQPYDGKKSHLLRGRCIATSLFNRLLPRWHYCMTQRTDAESPDEPIPLHILVGATDAAFCEHVGIGYDDYWQYKTESIPRLKFSSQFDTWLKTGRPIDVDERIE